MLRKPSEYFKQDTASISNSVQDFVKRPDLGTFSDAFETFRNNLNKFEVISEKVEEIQNEIQNLLKKEDLDNAMMCQLFIVEDSIKDVQNKVKSINEKNLTEIRADVSELTETVNQFIEVEVPKYKKVIVDSELRFEKRANQVFDENNNLCQEIQDEFKTLKTLSEIVHEDYQFREDLSNKVADLHLEIVRNETHIKVQNKNLQIIREEVEETLSKINLEEFEEKSYKLAEKIKYLDEVFEKFNEKEILSETLLVEPPSTNNQDSLTPLDQKFVTLDQLQDHYRLFINRIQQQLSTLGGGGETRLKYLDDIVGIATNASAYDGKVLSYNHTIGKFEFITGGGGVGAAITISSTPPLNPQQGNLWYDNTLGRTFIYYQDVDGSQWVDASPSGGTPTLISNYWESNVSGISTVSSVGIGTVNPTSKLSVDGDVNIIGITTSTVVVPTQLKSQSVAEKTTLIDGNFVELTFSTGGGNVAICTNPTGDITLNVNSIPTDSSFDNYRISFSIIVSQTGTARTCTLVNLNGVSRPIKWSGGSLMNALSGISTSNGYDIFTFTGINTVGSASTTDNYIILGTVSGGFS